MNIKTLLNSIFWVWCVLFSATFILAGPLIAPPEVVKKYPVIIKNDSAPTTYWSIYKVNEIADYTAIASGRDVNDDALRMLELEPGKYEIVQITDVEKEYKGIILKWFKIVDVVKFEVKLNLQTLIIELK